MVYILFVVGGVVLLSVRICSKVFQFPPYAALLSHSCLFQGPPGNTCVLLYFEYLVNGTGRFYLAPGRAHRVTMALEPVPAEVTGS